MFYLFGENDEPKWYTGPKLCNTHGSHTHVYNIYTYAITLYYKTQTKDEIDFKYIQQLTSLLNLLDHITKDPRLLYIPK